MVDPDALQHQHGARWRTVADDRRRVDLRVGRLGGPLDQRELGAVVADLVVEDGADHRRRRDRLLLVDDVRDVAAARAGQDRGAERPLGREHRRRDPHAPIECPISATCWLSNVTAVAPGHAEPSNVAAGATCANKVELDGALADVVAQRMAALVMLKIQELLVLAGRVCRMPPSGPSTSTPAKPILARSPARAPSPGRSVSRTRACCTRRARPAARRRRRRCAREDDEQPAGRRRRLARDRERDARGLAVVDDRMTAAVEAPRAAGRRQRRAGLGSQARRSSSRTCSSRRTSPTSSAARPSAAAAATGCPHGRRRAVAVEARGRARHGEAGERVGGDVCRRSRAWRPPGGSSRASCQSRPAPGACRCGRARRSPADAASGWPSASWTAVSDSSGVGLARRQRPSPWIGSAASRSGARRTGRRRRANATSSGCGTRKSAAGRIDADHGDSSTSEPELAIASGSARGVEERGRGLEVDRACERKPSTPASSPRACSISVTWPGSGKPEMSMVPAGVRRSSDGNGAS